MTRHGGEGIRLWRVRRRHHHLDAIVWPSRGHCRLQYILDGRVLLERPHDSREAAASEAEARLRDLQRAGWNTHW